MGSKGWQCVETGVAGRRLVNNIAVVSWVTVSVAWRVVRLRMEERRPVWRIPENILNVEPRTADKEWSSSLGVGRGVDKSLP